VFKKLFKLREQADSEAIKPFLDHMEDLRWTLVKMISTLFVGMAGAFMFRKQLFTVMLEPLRPFSENPASVLQMTGVADSIMVSLTLAFYAGIVVTFPFLLFFLLEFVLPALTRQEKKYVVPGIMIGFVFFIVGVAAAYRFTLEWLHSDAVSLGVKAQWMVRDYFSFVTRMCIGFGLLGELPPVMTVLALLGFVSFAWLSRTRPYAIVLILILAAFIAPSPDPTTLFMIGGPVLVLYELCIWLVWLIEWNRRRKARKETPPA
jgi:sec-independent protein translocase protein TatC